jgi:hypothetical protein
MKNSHIFLHSPEIQEQIRQSEDDLKSGRYVKFDANEIDKMLNWLSRRVSRNFEIYN